MRSPSDVRTGVGVDRRTVWRRGLLYLAAVRASPWYARLSLDIYASATKRSELMAKHLGGERCFNWPVTVGTRTLAGRATELRGR
jgi:hypothetical protein